MSLDEQIQFILSRKMDILSMGIFFGILGVIVYFLFPSKHVAVGNLYVGRSVQNNTQNLPEPTEFSYEGYYARQNAVTYASTIAGILETESTSQNLLERLSKPVTAENIRKINRNTKIKKLAPQLIEVSFKDISSDVAKETWVELTDYIIDLSTIISEDTDPGVRIVKVNQEPLVKESYKNPFLNFGIGLSVGILLSTFVLAFEEYLSTSKAVKKKK